MVPILTFPDIYNRCYLSIPALIPYKSHEADIETIKKPDNVKVYKSGRNVLYVKATSNKDMLATLVTDSKIYEFFVHKEKNGYVVSTGNYDIVKVKKLSVQAVLKGLAVHKL